MTGASNGIGFELAKLFADDGYDLVIAAEDDAMHASADKLAIAGIDVRPVRVDLRKPEDIRQLYCPVTGGSRRLAAAALNAAGGRMISTRMGQK